MLNMSNRTIDMDMGMDMVSPNRVRGTHYPSLVRQDSLCNLTFDEVQSRFGNTGGKPLHCMHLDELLKTVISAESGQLVQNPSASSPASFFLGHIHLNGTLSKKTIDEVQREIVHQEHVNRMDNHNDNHLQQSNLGEMTLEEFLDRARMTNGVKQDNNIVAADAESQPLMAIDPMVMVSSQQTNWLPLQMQMQIPAIHIHQQEQHQQDQQHQQISGLCPDYSVSKSVYENPVMEEIGYSENSLAISVPAMAAMSSTASSDSQVAAAQRKRRHSDEMLEKSIERRQKRMIKNRESAARSRARKQAYTNHLENEKFRLQKTNSWLKKLKEVEAQLFSDTNLMPRYQLRRTSSATF